MSAAPSIVTLVMQARAQTVNIMEQLATGRHANKSPVTPMEREPLKVELAACNDILSEHPEETARQNAQSGRTAPDPPAQGELFP